MHWDYLIVASAIAAALVYLARRRALRKYGSKLCNSSSLDCACCPQASAKRHGARNDD